MKILAAIAIVVTVVATCFLWERNATPAVDEHGCRDGQECELRVGGTYRCSESLDVRRCAGTWPQSVRIRVQE